MTIAALYRLDEPFHLFLGLNMTVPFPDAHPAAPWAVLYLILAIVLVASGSERPLQSIHWDGPIHLYQAKRFAETPLARSYARNAEAIAAQVVDGKWPPGEAGPESYWRFTRFGHIALLGSIVHLFGGDTAAIAAAHWLYLAMMVATLAIAAHMSVEFLILCGTPGSRSTHEWAVVLATVIYSLSFVFGYVGRSLVSEAPALLCLAVGAWALVRAVALGSGLLAALAGLCAFLAYTARMESVWVLLALALALPLPGGAARAGLLRVHAIAGLTAFTAFVAYAWIFWPLSDPRLYVTFAKYQGYVRQELPWFAPLSSVVAFGWVGMLACAAAFRWRGALRSLVWGFLCLVPSLPYLLSGLPIQSRQFSPLMLPVLAASTIGWSYLMQNAIRKRQGWSLVLAGCSIALIAAVSCSSSYQALKLVPGLWRLSYLRQLMVPTAYEQLSFPYLELREISHELYQASGGARAVLVWGTTGHLEHLNLIRYFGPSYGPRSDLALVSDPTNPRDCDAPLPDLPEEPLVFCTSISSALLESLAAQRVHVFHLTVVRADENGLFYLKQSKDHRDGIPAGARRTVVSEHDHLVLELISPEP